MNDVLFPRPVTPVAIRAAAGLGLMVLATLVPVTAAVAAVVSPESRGQAPGATRSEPPCRPHPAFPESCPEALGRRRTPPPVYDPAFGPESSRRAPGGQVAVELPPSDAAVAEGSSVLVVLDPDLTLPELAPDDATSESPVRREAPDQVGEAAAPGRGVRFGPIGLAGIAFVAGAALAVGLMRRRSRGPV